MKNSSRIFIQFQNIPQKASQTNNSHIPRPNPPSTLHLPQLISAQLMKLTQKKCRIKLHTT